MICIHFLSRVRPFASLSGKRTSRAALNCAIMRQLLKALPLPFARTCVFPTNQDIYLAIHRSRCEVDEDTSLLFLLLRFCDASSSVVRV